MSINLDELIIQDTQHNITNMPSSMNIYLLLVIHLSPENFVFGGERSMYIVHMDNSFMPKPFTHQFHWYAFTVNSLMSSPEHESFQKNPRNLVYTYNHAFHGFSAILSKSELEYLEKVPGFVSAYSDKHVTLDTTHTPEFLSLNPQTGLWPASDLGKDVIIGVIDTGIWPESPSFSDLGMTPIPKKWKGTCQVGQDFNSSLCNNKLIGVRYFYKGVEALNPNVTIQMKSGRDTVGHGTHISSIVCGNYVNGANFHGYAYGTARGMAPRARLAVYKVVWPEGQSVSDVLAGIDQAISDGVEVISISLASNNVPLYQDPIAIASFGAMEKGIIVSTSAGNSQNIGSLHNGIPWVLTVTAGSTDRLYAGILILGNGVTIAGWSIFPAPAIVVNQSLLYNEPFPICNPSDALSKAGYSIVICEEENTIYSQMLHLMSSDIAAAIFISEDPYMLEQTYFPFPGVVVSPAQADILIGYVTTTANASASLRLQRTLVGIGPAPVVASYTSRGPSPSYPGILKPDIMAPGTLILGSWIPNQITTYLGRSVQLTSDFLSTSGTLVACPHASGIAALLKGAHPEWSPAAIRSALITTANPRDNKNGSITDSFLKNEIASPLAMGAGHIDPNAALNPGLVYDATPQDYVNYPSFIALYNTGSTTTSLVQKFNRTVTNVGDFPASYNVQIIAPEGSVVSVSPKRLVFNSKNEKQSYQLTLQYNSSVSGKVTFGEVSWVDENNQHVVRSPIVVSPMIPVW